jgi:hypothetical protein
MKQEPITELNKEIDQHINNLRNLEKFLYKPNITEDPSFTILLGLLVLNCQKATELKKHNTKFLVVADNLTSLLEALRSFDPEYMKKWDEYQNKIENNKIC